jgi:aerobic-type carbon monoxide dehydrogenase small subunit (CoxS/CutS family)
MHREWISGGALHGGTFVDDIVRPRMVHACLVFAVQAAFRERHGLQCGFCTPGFVVSATALLRDNPRPTDQQIREGLSGNLCRCTGYQGILAAVRAAAGGVQAS